MRRRGMLASKDAKLKLHNDSTSASFTTDDLFILHMHVLTLPQYPFDS